MTVPNLPKGTEALGLHGIQSEDTQRETGLCRAEEALP